MGSQVPQYTQSVCQTTKMLNMLKLLLLLASTCTIFAINPFRGMFPEIKTHKVHSHKEVGDPLFLTPMLKDGKIKEAQEASVVKLPEAPHIPSFAGFITVNELFQSNMFFWYFPAAYDFENAPVVLWLQGGPGGSSLFGLFAENGPFSVNEKLWRLPTRHWPCGPPAEGPVHEDVCHGGGLHQPARVDQGVRGV